MPYEEPYLDLYALANATAEAEAMQNNRESQLGQVLAQTNNDYQTANLLAYPSDTPHVLFAVPHDYSAELMRTMQAFLPQNTGLLQQAIIPAMPQPTPQYSTQLGVTVRPTPQPAPQPTPQPSNQQAWLRPMQPAAERVAARLATLPQQLPQQPQITQEHTDIPALSINNSFSSSNPYGGSIYTFANGDIIYRGYDGLYHIQTPDGRVRQATNNEINAMNNSGFIDWIRSFFDVNAQPNLVDIPDDEM